MFHAHKTRLIGAAALLALTAGCHHKEHADAAKTETEVKDNMTQLVAAFTAGDVEKAVSFDAPDMVGMFHGAPNTVGQEADRAVTKMQMSDPAKKLAVSDVVVNAARSGDLAVWRAKYNYTYTDPATKQVKAEEGNWVVGWIRDKDGKLKESWSVVSDTPSPAAAKPAG
jgi:ketosteroid isomerase-like protein